ncbi:MAG TPA: recombinase RecT [Candidatus Alectryocaccomicrobium excrementavium]|uniref:Recombinase RecT n=1 Tax=Candidatus Alectryocaccomicrobium excrementavium TaxID=2840668 RepID=A0A9D1K606_9FIRM|nr:recombinase RecT [Candidatus Alectryocaccomicrobium excrementavium]
MAEIRKPASVGAELEPRKNGVAKSTKTALDYLHTQAFASQLEMALPKFFDKDRFVRSAISEFRLNPALQECSVPSVLGFYMQAAMCGLEPSSALGQCYPVPFNNKKSGMKECQFVIGYRGMAAIARRSGDVMSIDAHIVHEKDDFELTYGLEQNLIHKPFIDGDPGPMRGAYCVVRFRDGSYQFRFMPKTEIDAHRARSKASSYGPWVTDYEAMAMKTVFRTIFKWLPISIEDAQHAAMDGTSATYNTQQALHAQSAEDMISIDLVAAEDDPEGETAQQEPAEA